VDRLLWVWLSRIWSDWRSRHGRQFIDEICDQRATKDAAGILGNHNTEESAIYEQRCGRVWGRTKFFGRIEEKRHFWTQERDFQSNVR
jgi:hypothetical protein